MRFRREISCAMLVCSLVHLRSIVRVRQMSANRSTMLFHIARTDRGRPDDVAAVGVVVVVLSGVAVVVVALTFTDGGCPRDSVQWRRICARRTRAVVVLLGYVMSNERRQHSAIIQSAPVHAARVARSHSPRATAGATATPTTTMAQTGEDSIVVRRVHN